MPPRSPRGFCRFLSGPNQHRPLGHTIKSHGKAERRKGGGAHLASESSFDRLHDTWNALGGCEELAAPSLLRSELKSRRLDLARPLVENGYQMRARPAAHQRLHRPPPQMINLHWTLTHSQCPMNLPRRPSNTVHPTRRRLLFSACPVPRATRPRGGEAPLSVRTACPRAPRDFAVCLGVSPRSRPPDQREGGRTASSPPQRLFGRRFAG
jgi:hypothetical protein